MLLHACKKWARSIQASGKTESVISEYTSKHKIRDVDLGFDCTQIYYGF